MAIIWATRRHLLADYSRPLVDAPCAGVRVDLPREFSVHPSPYLNSTDTLATEHRPSRRTR